MKANAVWLLVAVLLGLLFVGVGYSTAPAPKTKDIPWHHSEGHS